jgi:hypothetical protein
MVTGEELIGTTEYLTLWERCHINRRRFNRVQLYIVCAQPLCSRAPLDRFACVRDPQAVHIYEHAELGTRTRTQARDGWKNG